MALGIHSAELTRRGVFAGALLFAGMGSAQAAPAAAVSLLSYEQRLRARLSDSGGGAFDPQFARSLLSHANQFRSSEGLAPYEWDEGLAACARAHAADMASRDFFAHESPEGFTHLDRTALLNRDFCGATSENLAWREDAAGSTPRQFEALWEASPGHRKNLLRQTYSRAAYGVVKAGAAHYAVGIYADASMRLARPLPFQVGRSADLADAMRGASPTIEQVAFTAPFKPPSSMISPHDAMPSLQSGVWQLRPLRRAGANRFDVLTGPVFLVS